MTYYTIPYKEDGSCCETCGPPEDPCSCPDEYEWYCVMAQLCTSGDCTTGCNDAIEMCLGLTPGQVAALPICVGDCIPGGPCLGGSIYVESIVSGPYDDVLACGYECPPWYCVRYTTYEGDDCTGDVVGVSYVCEQLQTNQIPDPGGTCISLLAPSLKMEVISGPYSTEPDCEVICETCCDFDVAYGDGTPGNPYKTATWTYYSETGTNFYFEVMENFTGTHVGAGRFDGTLTTKTRACARSDVLTCYDPGTSCDPWSENSVSESLYVKCSTDTFGRYYYCGFDPSPPVPSERDASLLANCGLPIGCDTFIDTECSATYSSDCLSIQGSIDQCASYYQDASCTTLLDRQWYRLQYSLSIV